MSEIALGTLACVVVALLASVALRRLKPEWSPLQTSLLSAAVLPAIVVALCAFVFIDAVTSPASECGVDACGMAAMAAMYVAICAALGFMIGWLAAFGFLGLLGRR
jgi:ABC-type spermidine/putrescine transport system permease subunit II